MLNSLDRTFVLTMRGWGTFKIVFLILPFTVITMAGFAGASLMAFIWWAWDVIVQKWSGGP